MTWNGFNEARVNRRVTQDFAQCIDSSVQALIEIDKRVIGPQTLPEFLAGNELARFFQHQDQHSECLLAQLNPSAVFAKFERIGV